MSDIEASEVPISVQYNYLTDVELVERAQEGDELSFNELFHRYDSKICTYLTRMIGEEGHDAAQETFIRAWSMLHKLQGEKNFEAWVYRIAGNLAKDHLRRKKLIQWLPWEGHEEHYEGTYESTFMIDGPEGDVIDLDFLAFAATRIPFKYWQCVIFQIVEERSQREIAQLLAINETSVSTYVKRGMEQLRQLYLTEGFIRQRSAETARIKGRRSIS